VRGEEFALSQEPNIDIIQKIWPSIETADPAHQKALAAAFRDLWQQQEKWKVKKSKKKQFQKVEMLKKILAEE
jgi:hypothetical protein